MSQRQFTILLYHGVSRASHRGIENFSQKHVSAAEFDRHMRHLRRHYVTLSLPELLDRSRDGTVPEDCVCVTFDDGFENNWSVAFPILERYGIPATFFLATGFIGTTRTFWVDKVEYLLNETRRSRVEVPSLMGVWGLSSDAERRNAVQQIKALVKSGRAHPDCVVAELEAAAGVEPRYDYLDYRMMTWDQVREMRASGLCTFGAHTVNHSIMSHLSPSAKRTEVGLSKRALESELNAETDLFSYPEGQEEHFDEETVTVLREAGYRASPTAMFGRNQEKSCPFHLRRNMVGFTAPFEQALEGRC